MRIFLRACDAVRFIERYDRLRLRPDQALSADGYLFPARNAHTGHGLPIIHKYFSRLDHAVRFPPGADAAGRDELIEAHSRPFPGHQL